MEPKQAAREQVAKEFWPERGEGSIARTFEFAPAPPPLRDRVGLSKRGLRAFSPRVATGSFGRFEASDATSLAHPACLTLLKSANQTRRMNDERTDHQCQCARKESLHH